jgi:antitoxin (DNA-binding transcriptional repressor) of toxin-antitoxin stability system
MEVNITQFRKDMFELVNKAMAGGEVWVTHRAHRFRLAPDGEPVSRLARIAPLEVTNPTAPKSAEDAKLNDMRAAWERDWSEL